MTDIPHSSWRSSAMTAGALLRLLASPTFAAMALLTATSERAAPMLCAAPMHDWILGGMSGMYLLMAARGDEVANGWLRWAFQKSQKSSKRRSQ